MASCGRLAPVGPKFGALTPIHAMVGWHRKRRTASVHKMWRAAASPAHGDDHCGLRTTAPVTISAMPNNPPRPRCAGSHVATSSYHRKSPKLTMILINWFAGRSGLARPFLALDPRSPARCSPVPATPNRIQSEAAFAHLCGAAPIRAAATHPPTPAQSRR